MIQSLQFDVHQTDDFASWFASLRDPVARARIDIRIRRLSLGNFGDAKPVGEGISELRIDHGPGYRVYLMRVDAIVVLLLAGGVKSGQARDIKRAKQLAQSIQD